MTNVLVLICLIFVLSRASRISDALDAFLDKEQALSLSRSKCSLHDSLDFKWSVPNVEWNGEDPIGKVHQFICKSVFYDRNACPEDTPKSKFQCITPKWSGIPKWDNRNIRAAERHPLDCQPLTAKKTTVNKKQYKTCNFTCQCGDGQLCLRHATKSNKNIYSRDALHATGYEPDFSQGVCASVVGDLFGQFGGSWCIFNVTVLRSLWCFRWKAWLREYFFPFV